MIGRLPTAIAAGVLVVVLALVVATVAGAAGDGVSDRAVDGNLEPPHGARPIAATQSIVLPVEPVLQAKAVSVAELQDARLLAYFTAVKAQQDEAARAAAAAAAARSARARPRAASSSGGNVLDCIRHRESRGNYGVTNRSSGAAGAYQFMPGTWNNTARSAGRSDLVGVNPANASPSDQDAMAQHLLATQGLGPWGGGCR
jgi:muramidase (phage lysozyme)